MQIQEAMSGRHDRFACTSASDLETDGSCATAEAEDPRIFATDHGNWISLLRRCSFLYFHQVSTQIATFSRSIPSIIIKEIHRMKLQQESEAMFHGFRKSMLFELFFSGRCIHTSHVHILDGLSTV